MGLQKYMLAGKCVVNLNNQKVLNKCVLQGPVLLATMMLRCSQSSPGMIATSEGCSSVRYQKLYHHIDYNISSAVNADNLPERTMLNFKDFTNTYQHMYNYVILNLLSFRCTPSWWSSFSSLWLLWLFSHSGECSVFFNFLSCLIILNK